MIRSRRARFVTVAAVGTAVLLASAVAVTDAEVASAHTGRPVASSSAANGASSSSTAPSPAPPPSPSPSPSPSSGLASSPLLGESSLPASAPATPTPPPAPSALRPVVVAIGDSIMNGHGVQPDQAWPVLLGQANDWRLTDLATDGAGFVQLGNDGTTFQSQVDAAAALDPSLVIISASSNDLGVDGDDLSAATLDTMTSLRTELPNAQIVALSAFWGDTDPPAELSDIDADLQTAAAATNSTYIDIGQPLAGRPQLMQSDDVHPTAEGLIDLEAAIAPDLAALQL